MLRASLRSDRPPQLPPGDAAKPVASGLLSEGSHGPSTVDRMFAAPVWHYWIGVLVFIPVMLITVGFIVAFLRKTQSPRYGRDD